MRILAAAALAAALVAHAAPARAEDACAAARGHAGRGDLLRASIAAGDCAEPEVARDVGRRAGELGWSPVEVDTRPAGGTVVVESAPDLPFAAPRRIWVPAGRHQVVAIVDGAPVASTWVVVRDGNYGRATLDLPGPVVITDGQVDMGDAGGGEVAAGAPPPQKFASLLPDRYLRGIETTSRSPLAAPPRDPRARAWRIAAGVRARTGGGAAAVVEVERRVPARGSPAVAAAVAAAFGDGEAEVLASAALQLRRGAASVGLGPAASVVVGRAGGAGGTLGGVATGAVDLGTVEVALRLDGGAAARLGAPWVAAGAVLLGLRW